MFIYGIEGYIDDTRGDTCVFRGVSAEEGQSSGGEDEVRLSCVEHTFKGIVQVFVFFVFYFCHK